MSHIGSGKVNVLAMTSQERWPGAESVPTAVEQGVKFTSYLWFGLMAPKGTPQPVIDYLHQQVVGVLGDPKMKETLLQQGIQGAAMPAAELGVLLEQDAKQWGQVVRDAKISAD
jgi:tripartite-type tricarboxylate transporter receptor subunit TctC